MKAKLRLEMFAILALAACVRPDPSNEKARVIWLKHERVLEGATKGKRTSGNDAMAAALFFERAGFQIPADHSTFIEWLPTSETPAALKSLHRWYRDNGNRLYLDPDSGEVKIRSPK